MGLTKRGNKMGPPVMQKETFFSSMYLRTLVRISVVIPSLSELKVSQVFVFH